MQMVELRDVMIHQMQLAFSGREMKQDEKTLADYYVQLGLQITLPGCQIMG
jgi:hypothetical protein